MQLIELINKLQKTTSKNEKIDLLKEVRTNTLIQKVFEYTYNPHYQFYIKKIALPHKSGRLSINDDKNINALIKLLDQLKERKITGNAAKMAVERFLEHFDKQSQLVIINIIKKDLRCGINVKTLNKAWGEFLPEPKFQLATHYDPNVDYKVDYWYASPKMDGIRMKFSSVNRLPIGRNNKLLKNLDNICNKLNVILDKFKLDFIDGEIYHHGVSFNKLQSIVSKIHKIDNKAVELLQYHIFACNGKSIDNTEAMLNVLAKINKFCREQNYYPTIQIVHYVKVKNDPIDIFNILQYFVKQGYEGVMLRHSKIHYENKRSNTLLKVKKFYTADLKIIGYIQGTGMNSDRLGAIIGEGVIEDRGKKIKVKAKVGSGFTYEQRAKIWQNRDKLLGKIIEVKYQNITKQKNSNEYSIRFPVFIRFKEL